MLSYLPQIGYHVKTVNKLTSLQHGDHFICQNGDIQIRPGTIGIVEICDRGLYWRRLCPDEYFWGPPQGEVACRQLNPGKAVIGNYKVWC